MSSRALHISLLLLTFATSTQTFIEAAPSIRGVHPNAAAEYQAAIAAGSFRCLDGSRSIAATAINDNYCDCGDGSDEPGTEAVLFPRSRGHTRRCLLICVTRRLHGVESSEYS